MDGPLGCVHKLRRQDFGFFWPPTPLRWHFLWYECWQKWTFLDHLPTSSCKRSLWTTPYLGENKKSPLIPKIQLNRPLPDTIVFLLLTKILISSSLKMWGRHAEDIRTSYLFYDYFKVDTFFSHAVFFSGATGRHMMSHILFRTLNLTQFAWHFYINLCKIGPSEHTFPNQLLPKSSFSKYCFLGKTPLHETNFLTFFMTMLWNFWSHPNLQSLRRACNIMEWLSLYCTTQFNKKYRVL